MKNMQFSSRKADQKVLIVLLCLGIPALVGCFLPPPFAGLLALLFDVVLSVALAVFVWCVFHLIEPRRHSQKWVIAELTIVPAIWLLLMLAVAVWFYHLNMPMMRDGRIINSL